MKVYVKNIEQGLTKVDPTNADDYQRNAALYIQKLDKLDVKLHKKIALIPEGKRKVITPHAAFAYMARDYKIDFHAPQGTSTESEASAGDVAKIIKQIRSEGIKAVFVENISDNRLIEQISRETDAKIGGQLYSDALSEPTGPAPTYLKMMEYNVDTIVNALK